MSNFIRALNVPADTIITETMFNLSDWDFSNTVVCPAGKYTEVFTKETDLEEIVAFGYGDKNQGVDDRGTLKVTLIDNANNEVKGKLRFKSRDRNDVRVVRGSAPRLSILQNGRNIAVDDVRVGARPEKFIVLELMPDEDVTLNNAHANVVLEVPVTQLQHPSFR